MNDAERAAYMTRDHVLKLLSDVENASISKVEDGDRLVHGDEYLDLEHLEYGVKRAHGDTVRMATVLPKKSIRADTWRQILDYLARGVDKSVASPTPMGNGDSHEQDRR